MADTLDVTSCLLDDSGPQTRKMSNLSASSGEHFMSRKRSIRERMREVEEKLSMGPKKPSPPSIFEAAAMIGKISGQRIDLLSANIQNEFGVCGWILTILSYLLIIVTLPISACMCIKVVQEYERAVIFRLGRLMPGGAKGPGIFFIVPCIDTYRKVDLRVLSFEVPPQEILSKDSVTVAVDAVVYFRISNATISVTNVEDAARSTKLLAQTTLRNILGTKTLAEMLSDREAISHQMQNTLDEATEPWGVKVERVEVKDVRLPVQLQRAMAAEAEAAREARAKVIVAEGEQKASRALKEAAEVIAQSPSALQLRYLQTLNSISAEKNSTIIFPFPIDLLSAFLQKPAPKIEEPPPLPKKIRSCCLYKYPDWVQGMVGEGKAPVSGGQHQHHASPWPPQGGSGPSTTTTSGRPPLPHSMREAQYHSAATGANTFQPTAAPTQLDPGQLDASRRSAGRIARGGSGGANSLLKQAIANRLKPANESPSPGDKEEEMSKSIVGNPAWYRDDDGRTGFKPKEWENLPNQQKDQVKPKRRRKPEADPDGKVENIDEELLKEKGEQEAEEQQKEVETPVERKLSKEEKKELKKKEKEEKKREKEEKKREKEEKKKLEKEEKKRRSTGSLDKVEEKKEDRKSEGNETDKEDKEKRKERRRREKEEKKRSSTSSLEKSSDKEGKEKKDDSQQKKEHGEKNKKDHEDKAKKEKRKIKEESPFTRRESSVSVASSSKSTDTVRHVPAHSQGKPPRPPQSNHPSVLGSPHSSSTEEERAAGRTVAAHKQPKKANIGERRDSSLSESSRISGVSHKSVTFSDKVQMHEIERIQLISSSEDDVAVMSDDELSKPDSDRRRRLVKLLQSQQAQEDSEEDEEIEIEEDDFEEQERLIEQQLQYPVYNLEDTGSHGSFYPEEADPDRYLMDDDGSYISLDKLPASVRRAIAMEMKARAEGEQNMGSMSKLHEQASPLLGPHQLPRSASGYLDNNYMVASYQQAMYGAFHHDDGVYRSPKQEGVDREQRRNLHESFYDNVPSRTSSLVGPAKGSQEVTPVPSPPRKSSSTSIDRRAFFEDTGSSTPSPPRVVVSQSSSNPQRVTVTTTTTSTMLTNRTEIMEREERLRKKAADEDEMRKRFVAKFGARRAPMAEEDPLDPGPTGGSQESVFSTDSRESVVSEASIRKENSVRRNFNY